MAVCSTVGRRLIAWIIHGQLCSLPDRRTDLGLGFGWFVNERCAGKLRKSCGIWRVSGGWLASEYCHTVLPVEKPPDPFSTHSNIEFRIRIVR